MLLAQSFALIAVLVRSAASPLVPAGSRCSTSTLRWRAGPGGDLAKLRCFADAKGVGSVCCSAEDVASVLEQLDHSQQFVLRHLSDRAEFYQQYKQAKLGDYPCAPAVEVMLAKRLEQLDAARVLTEAAVSIMAATVEEALCIGCFAAGRDASPSAHAGGGFAAEWEQISRGLQQLHEELRQHDAAVAGSLRESGHKECIFEFIEAQRRGVPAPAMHRVPLRPWDVGLQTGVTSFKEVWQRWIDGLVSVASEFAEGLLAETEGLLLAFQQTMKKEAAAAALLVQPPIVESGEDALSTRLHRPKPSSIFPGGSSAALTLLVALPPATTNLRFNFDADAQTLDEAQLQRHVAALLDICATSGGGVRAMVVTPNPMHGVAVQQALRACKNMKVVWRRFAPFLPDPLAISLADASAAAAAQRIVAFFEVPVGGDSQGLAQATKWLASHAADLEKPWSGLHWPRGLRIARPPQQGLLQLQMGGMPESAGLAYRPRLAGDGACPIAAQILSDYLQLHRKVRDRLRNGITGDKVLIYRCSALGFCGGHGDRLNGLLGAFLIAVVSHRAFFIDAPRPVPLHLILHPRRLPSACGMDGGEFILDWRMHGSIAASGRRVNYNDRYNDLVADMPWLLADETEPVVVLNSNQRVTFPILATAEARASLGPQRLDSLTHLPFLHAALLELLFEPTALLAGQLAKELEGTLRGRRHLLAIHFRAGNKSPQRWSDPPRHGMEDLEGVLACAASAEAKLGWRDNEAAWYIAADTAEVASSPTMKSLFARGKVSTLPQEAGASVAAGIIHLDRSAMGLAVQGVVDTWAQWLMLSVADAVVLSASGFGVTAAEAGRVHHAFLGPHGCLDVDLTAP